MAMSPDPEAPRLVGPYMLRELVHDLPLESPETPEKTITITCLEAWCRQLLNISTKLELTSRR